jgi:hypothetical protein
MSNKSRRRVKMAAGASGESMRNAENFPISESAAAVVMPDHMTLPLLP